MFTSWAPVLYLQDCCADWEALQSHNVSQINASHLTNFCTVRVVQLLWLLGNTHEYSLVPGSLNTNAVLMIEQMYATIENHQSLDSARKGPAMQPLCTCVYTAI